MGTRSVWTALIAILGVATLAGWMPIVASVPSVADWMPAALARSAVRDQSSVAFDAGDLGRAERLATRLLRSDPADPVAARNLALVRAARGDQPGAFELMQAASDASLRDTTIQRFLLAQGGAVADVPAILDSADALLRRDRASAEIFPILRTLATAPEARPTLVDLLVRPGNQWRSQFVRSIENSERLAAEAPAMAILLREVQARGAPITREEVAATVRALVETRAFGEARRLWAAGNAERRFLTPTVYDPGFGTVRMEAENTALTPFDWAIGQSGAASAFPAEAEGAAAGLSVQATGRGRGVIASQMLVLSPGRYAANFRYSTDALLEEVLMWRIVCIAEENFVVGSNDTAVREDTMVSIPFTVPPEGCPAQNLRLESSPSRSGRQTSALLRSVDIVRTN